MACAFRSRCNDGDVAFVARVLGALCMILAAGVAALGIYGYAAKPDPASNDLGELNDLANGLALTGLLAALVTALVLATIGATAMVAANASSRLARDRRQSAPRQAFYAPPVPQPPPPPWQPPAGAQGQPPVQPPVGPLGGPWRPPSEQPPAGQPWQPPAAEPPPPGGGWGPPLGPRGGTEAGASPPSS